MKIIVTERDVNQFGFNKIKLGQYYALRWNDFHHLVVNKSLVYVVSEIIFIDESSFTKVIIKSRDNIPGVDDLNELEDMWMDYL